MVNADKTKPKIQEKTQQNKEKHESVLWLMAVTGWVHRKHNMKKKKKKICSANA